MVPKKVTKKPATKKIAKSKLTNLSELLKNPRATKVQKRKKLSSYSTMYEKAIKRKKETYKKLYELAKKDPKKVVGLEEFDHNLFLDCNENFGQFFKKLSTEIKTLEAEKKIIDKATKELD